MNMLSTIHDPVFGPPVTRKRKAQGAQGYREFQITCPLAISQYNQGMGGVDLNDQLSVLRKDMRQMRWYFRVFLKCIMLSDLNAYIMEDTIKPHREDQGKIKHDILSFKDNLVSDLTGQVRASRKLGRKRTRKKFKKTSLMTTVS